ncbi:phosphopantetheine-binding protein [Micromonospora sp. NBC_00421]|uniref:phosphopantetheine-binding protein n=1 Tax=Micromonospora sp. NBC_00421 TaxID=2975976 RepID=UPI002E1AD843
MNEISYAQSSLAEEDVPSTATERAIAEVWAEVLNLDEVGRHDNFFDLGGHSVLATQAVARLSVALGRDLPERALFDWPTVATLASALPGYPVSTPDAPIRRR